MAGQPAKPLPPILEKFLDDSPDGAIIVSFGSYFDFIPEYLRQKFCQVFRRLKYHVIWKLGNDSVCGDVANVKILPWIPQNDLLGHRNVRLLITHGGVNSILESVYHAVPIIVFPLAFDQHGNAQTAVNKGYGLRMDIADFSVETLTTSIESIFNDESFDRNARFYSSIVKDKETLPAHRVSHMINHVIKHGDRHLRTGAFELTTLQYFMFDIFLFLWTFVVIAVIVSVTCVYFSCKFVFKRLHLKDKHKND